MTCQDVAPLLDAHLDGELDLVRTLEIEKHLETCSACASMFQSRQALRTTLVAARLSQKAPEALRQWVIAKGPVQDRAPSPELPNRNSQRWMPASALVAAFAILFVGLRFVSQSALDRRLAEEVVSAHVRSLMATHLTDVTSTDQHTVKPWFNGKIDFAPAVRDLSDYSFPLLGGRLDYLSERPVAALVYKRQQHFINLFVWPSPKTADRTEHALTHRGYNLLTWTRSGMTYWAVSDLNRRELGEFVQIIQAQSILS